jgi:hypothetical protein
MAVVGHLVLSNTGNPENPYQVQPLPTCAAVPQYNPDSPVSPVSPSLISVLKLETSRDSPGSPRRGLEDKRRRGELWDSIDGGELSSFPGRAPLDLFGTCPSCRNNRVLG